MEIALHILVLSPHRDDAAFSLAFSLRHWLAAGHRVTLVNAFTCTNYAPFSEAVTVDDVSRIRKGEDEAFVRSMGDIALLDLDLEDAPLRLSCDSGEVCELPVSPDDAAIQSIYSALEQHRRDAALVLPLALGRHVDHRTARDAVMALITRMPCAFYEDLPYAMRDGASADLATLREELMSRFGKRLSPVLCSRATAGAMAFKKQKAMLYDSQIDEPQADAIAGFCKRYGGAERLWVNDAWQALAARATLSAQRLDEAWEPLPA